MARAASSVSRRRDSCVRAKHPLYMDTCAVRRTDDIRDLNWHIEQAHRTYGHSYLNIALTRSSRPHETCLGTRWLQREKGVEVQDVELPVHKDGKPYTLYARPAVHFRDTYHTEHCGPTHFPYHRPRFDKSIPSRPLLESRAFLQEQIISPRTLHVDTTELAWECRINTGCECRLSTTYMDDLTLGTTSVQTFKLCLARDRTRTQWWPPSKVWDDIRRDYIQRTFDSTGPFDMGRLSSLIGLASCLQPLMNKRFVAGLFASNVDDLARELLWYLGAASSPKAGGARRRRVQSTPLLPSWSWAKMETTSPYSVGTPEHMFDPPYGGRFGRDPDFRIRSVDNVRPPGIEPKQPGEQCLHAVDWELHVSGKLINGKIAVRKHDVLHPGTEIYKFVAANAEHSPPPLPPASPGSLPARRTRWGAELPPPTVRRPPFPVGYVMMDCDEFDHDRRNSAAAVLVGFTWAYLLLVGRVVRCRRPEDVVGNAGGEEEVLTVDVGLALRRAGDGKTGKFERIGLFWLPGGQEGLFGEGQVQDIVLV